MKYALYEKATGKIVSVVQSTDPPQEFDDALGYADFPEDADRVVALFLMGLSRRKLTLI